MFASPRFRPSLPRHFAWLLWLAMLLPAAQTLASCHLYSHDAELAAAGADHGRNKHAAVGSHCDLCLVGTIAHGGGMPPAELLPPLPPIVHAAPHAAFASSWTPLLLLAYQGRAPPSP